MPHLRRALDLRERVVLSQRKQGGLETVLDLFGTPTLLTSATGIVVHANKPAEAMLRAGPLIRSAGDRLVLVDSSFTRALLRRIARAAGDGAWGLMTLPEQQGTAPVVVIAPAGPRGLAPGERGHAAVFLFHPACAEGASRALLRQLFGLTPAEVAVVSEVQKGSGLGAAASALGIGMATARTHLHRAFEKTGTKRQSQLIRLLDALPSN